MQWIKSDFSSFLKRSKKGGSVPKDLHIIRFFSSFVAISNGKVIRATEPKMKYCPLAFFLFQKLTFSLNSGTKRMFIKKAIEQKIKEFGHFTARRELNKSDIAVPYGASEILMYSMRKGYIDAAVVVCDGAGTVIATKPGTVQGIGARMNGLFYTSPIKSVIKRLQNLSSHVVFKNARINQIKGVREAAKRGFKHIAVTINGFTDRALDKLAKIEKRYKVSITSLLVCTTGISKKRIGKIAKHIDIMWACGSSEVRRIIGRKAIIQISKKIPVFALTKKGINLVSLYSQTPLVIRNLDLEKQYLIAKGHKGKKIKMGIYSVNIGQADLPIRDLKEPS